MSLMNNQLIAYFTHIMQLSEDEIDAIVESMSIKQYKKGTILLREGETSDEAYFVLEGCVRQYYLVDGEERTMNFFTENQWVISTQKIDETSPANYYIDCCIDTKLVVGNVKKEQDLYRRFPRLETVSRKVMEQAFSEQHELMSSYLTDSPEERYLQLLKKRPELFQLIPQYMIASYIRVKPESLSRIRKRIAKQQG